LRTSRTCSRETSGGAFVDRQRPGQAPGNASKAGQRPAVLRFPVVPRPEGRVTSPSCAAAGRLNAALPLLSGYYLKRLMPPCPSIERFTACADVPGEGLHRLCPRADHDPGGR
jgi:hypothetical protein